jgi:ribosomal protein L7Ae-like RNA K-turn-binding protein
MTTAAKTPGPAPDPLLGWLGLGRRAGRLVVGVDAVREGLQTGKVHCVILSADASKRARERLVRLASAKGVPLLAGPAAERMGAGLGLSTVMAVAVADRSLAAGLMNTGAAVPWAED